MNNRRRLTCVLGIGLVPFVLLSGCSATNASGRPGGGSGSTTTSNGPPQVVHVVASNFLWTIDKTVFSAGKPIEFEVSSKEGMHGFSIDGTSISKAVSPGQTVDVTWNPPKAGKYTIRCDMYCGSGHNKMFTSFTVKNGEDHAG